MQSEKSKVFTIRLPEDLRNELEKRAKIEGRSLSNLVIFLLRNALKSL